MICTTVLVCALQIGTTSPPVQISQLDFLLGDWTGSVQGSSVRLDIERGPGKRSLRFEVAVSGKNVASFIDDGYIWWDKEPGAFRSLAMTSVSNDPRQEIGRLVDGTLVMVSEPFEVGGMSQRSRRSLKMASEGLSFTLELREADVWKKRIEVVLKRAAQD